MSPTKIEWCDETWNPLTGCTRVSEGCRNCYAERMSARLAFNPQTTKYEGVAEFHGRDGAGEDCSDPRWTGVVRFHPETLAAPLRWRKPRRIFVCSMSDLFHEGVEPAWQGQILRSMVSAPQHTYQILTKRPERMEAFFRVCLDQGVLPSMPPWIWLGTSVEDQETADERIPHLLRCPAAIRFVSYEPAIGPVDFTHLDLTWKLRDGLAEFAARQGRDPMEAAATVEPGVAHINALRGYWFDGWDSDTELPPLDWVIAGGESGLGARPPHPKWFRDVRDQCEAAGVAFHFKQWGEWAPDEEEGVSKTALVRFSANTAVGMGRWAPTYMYRVGKRAAGRLLDGREHSEYPA